MHGQGQFKVFDSAGFFPQADKAKASAIAKTITSSLRMVLSLIFRAS
jgi:hypothetical protein